MEYSLLSNIRWQYSLANQVTTAANCFPHVVQVENIHILAEEFMDYCLSSLPITIKSVMEVEA